MGIWYLLLRKGSAKSSMLHCDVDSAQLFVGLSLSRQTPLQSWGWHVLLWMCGFLGSQSFLHGQGFPPSLCCSHMAWPT